MSPNATDAVAASLTVIAQLLSTREPW
jgi:hypothetical protein